MAELDDIEKERDSYRAWSKTCSSYVRHRSIQGSLIGIAIGEGLGLPRNGLSKRASVRAFGRTPFEFRLAPGLGIAADQFHLSCVAGQAILRSYQKERKFLNTWKTRRCFYVASHPMIWMDALRAKRSGGSTPFLLSSLLLSTIVLQGSGAKGVNWIESQVACQSPKISDSHTLVIAAGKLAIHSRPEQLRKGRALRYLSDSVSNPDLQKTLLEMEAWLADGKSAKWVARKLGWGDKVPNEAEPIVIMSVYSWLRHSHRYRLVVESAISLGGPTAALGALAGGLAGANLGKKMISPHWRRRFASWPHGEEWIDQFSERLKEWPHGVSDLDQAPALPSYPLGQFIRSLALVGLFGLNRIIRAPWSISQRLIG